MSKCDLSVCVSYQFTAHQLESYSYLFCDNGLDPCITSRLQSAHCQALSRKDTREGCAGGRGCSWFWFFHFISPSYTYLLTQTEAARTAKGSLWWRWLWDPDPLCHQVRPPPACWQWWPITPHTCCLRQSIAHGHIGLPQPAQEALLSSHLPLSCPVTG